ncbi:MAG: BsuPI-related putative proteinase inhibitor [Gemmatimonadales bacterium]
MPAPIFRLSFRPAALASLLLACGGADETRDQPPEAGQAAAPPALELTLTTAQPSWAAGDSAVAVLTLRNTGGEPAVLNFTSGQRYDFSLLGTDNDTLWSWSSDKGFIQALGQETVPPGDQIAWEERIPLPSRPGTYMLAGSVTSPDAPTVAPIPVVVTPP